MSLRTQDGSSKAWLQRTFIIKSVQYHRTLARIRRVIVLHDENFDALSRALEIIAHEWTPICPIWSLWLWSSLQVGPSVIETPRNSARQVNKWVDCSFQRDVIIYSLLKASNRVNLHDLEYSEEMMNIILSNNDMASVRVL